MQNDGKQIGSPAGASEAGPAWLYEPDKKPVGARARSSATLSAGSNLWQFSLSSSCCFLVRVLREGRMDIGRTNRQEFIASSCGSRPAFAIHMQMV